ncbi:hypothetical protein [Roseateles sp. P5_E11]
MDDSVFNTDSSAVWHVYWQAAAGRDLLADPSLISRVRSRLLDAHRQAGRELLYFLLTPTEIHLLAILTGGESPGHLARGFANVVARWVRDVQGSPGPVFVGRYQARRVESEDALHSEVRMLAWRPVAMKLCVAATHFRHSALRIVLGLSRPEGFHAAPLLGQFGSTVLQARALLRAALAKRPSQVEVLQWELARGLTLAGGSVGPMGRMSRKVRGGAAALVAASGSKGIDGALHLLERWVEAKLGMRAGQRVALQKGVAGARGRALVAMLAVRSGLCSAASVARHFKRAKATMSEQMAAARRRPEDQQILATPMARIVAEALSLAAEAQEGS